MRAQGASYWMPLALALVGHTAGAAEWTTCGDLPVEGCQATLQGAIDAAADGDVILVADGIYEENLLLDGRTLELRGDSTGVPELMGTFSAEPAVAVRGGALTLSHVRIATSIGRPLIVEQGARADLSHVTLRSTGLQHTGGLVLLKNSAMSCTSCELVGGQAVASGGQIFAEESSLTLTSSLLTDGQAYSGASVYWHSPSGAHLEVDDCNFTGHAAIPGQGSAIAMGGASEGDGSSFAIRGSRFRENYSTFQGVVAIHGAIATGVIEQSVFSENTSDMGTAAVHWHGGSTGTFERNLVCGNRTESDPDAGTVDLWSIDQIDVRNNQFLRNAQGALYVANDGSAIVRNNHFVQNRAASYPVLRVSYGVDSVVFADNLLVDNSGTTSFSAQVYSFETNVLSEDHTLAWNNSPPYPTDSTVGDVYGDPLLSLDADGSRCEYVDSVNGVDPMWPSWHGAARDAGSDRDVDIDGSPLDIGAFGGTSARAEPDWLDVDQDGVPALFDCHRYNAEIASGLPDAPYDGVDSDCRGDDDFDGDDDGYRHVDYALEGEISDCDDANALRNPGRLEVANNGLDDDCDGWADNVGGVVATRCAVGSSAPSWFLLVVAALLWRRRQAVGATRGAP